MADFGASAALIGHRSGRRLGCVGVGAPANGMLADRMGSRRLILASVVGMARTSRWCGWRAASPLWETNSGGSRSTRAPCSALASRWRYAVLLYGSYYRGLLTCLPDVLAESPHLGEVDIAGRDVDPA